MAGASVHCQLHSQNALTSNGGGKSDPGNHRQADSYSSMVGTPERLRGSGYTSKRLRSQLGVRNGSRVPGLASIQKNQRCPLREFASADFRPRKRSFVVPLSSLGGCADASAFQPNSERLPESERPFQPIQRDNVQQEQNHSEQLQFDPLSLSRQTPDHPSEKQANKLSLTVQLSAALCVALFIAARNTVPPSSFLSLSVSTSSQTGPSALQAFHPLVQIAWTGLVTGCLHTMTGPDHLASLAPLTIGRSRVQSALLGALWGAGHGSGQLLLGSIFLLFKDKIEHLLPVLSRWSSTLVGLILIIIGAHGVYESLLPIDDDAMEFTSYVGTCVNGFTFGLQPDALMMILPALALPSRASAASFLGAFLLGTILAMGTYSGCIGAASEALGKRMPWLTQRLSQISGVIAIGLGLFFVVTNVLGL